ncbi:hypothetical protein B9Z55_008299 [Caenorhabditis nigoni]|uniref:Uncharacterized protein n=1 Tax=Caenorhabditis nigoni TaxID=1611254 RepID=A0A2G5VDK7_9PELO|nr:hypothetical protein B9Z55_008299 [Caenorhabditis nigoni]
MPAMINTTELRDSPKSDRSSQAVIDAKSDSSEKGSESPRSLRDYHRGGSGSLTGGGAIVLANNKPVCLLISFLKLSLLPVRDAQQQICWGLVERRNKKKQSNSGEFSVIR